MEGTSEIKPVQSLSVNLPKGGGAVKGIRETFTPNLFTGTSSVSIPIPTDNARGFSPQLALSYSSGAGNSAFGLGFNLGVSMIQRRTDKGIPQYNEHDIILFNSEECVPKLVEDTSSKKWGKQQREENLSNTSYLVTVYVPRNEGAFNLMEFWEAKDNSSSFWKIRTADNTVETYGSTTESQITDPSDASRIFSWLLLESQDAYENVICYSYKEDASPKGTRQFTNRYLEKIDYCNYTDKKGATQWGVQVVFDYGAYDLSNPSEAYKPTKNWVLRQDSFSSFRSGFEIRTQRLCQNVLVFHRFDELGKDPCLINSTSITYDENPVASQVKSIAQTGYSKNSKGETVSKSIPAVDFDYSPFSPQKQKFTAWPASASTDQSTATASAMIGSGFQFMDLYGEGIAGLFTNINNQPYYYEPVQKQEINSIEAATSFPQMKGLSPQGYQLMDVDGSGVPDLVLNQFGTKGFYSNTIDRSWNNYQVFRNNPVEDESDGLSYLDVSGRGLSDKVLFDQGDVRYYPSERAQGYGAPVDVVLPSDFPLATPADEQVLVTFSNMFGDGLSHRVRIQNGKVECWPNLGYGRFGEKISFENAPDFGEGFQTRYLFLADVDGTGTTDLVYFYSDYMEVYLNQSGNSFSKVAIKIDLPDQVDFLSSIQFADVFGNGTTSCIVSKAAATLSHQVFDFSNGLKPYLLISSNNNQGQINEVDYASSVKFYLADKAAGNKWQTRLPMPVMIIERSRVIDQISNATFETRYSYHEGYYDPVEREFRGFGLVEQWDTQTFKEYKKGSSSEDTDHYTPPVYTKTWHHLGENIDEGPISKQFQGQYFKGDKDAYELPDSQLVGLKGESGETTREAYVAMAGTVLREEVYGLDGSKQEHIPYSVSESNVIVKMLQPSVGDKYGVFIKTPSESIQYYYERNASDPRVAHTITLAQDNYGHVTQSASIVYPRRSSEGKQSKSANPALAIQPEQQALTIIVSEQQIINVPAQYTDTSKEEAFRRIGVNCEAKSFELGNVQTPSTGCFTVSALQGIVDTAMKDEIAYGLPFDESKQQAGLYHWERVLFWDDDFTTELSLGDITALAKTHHVESVVNSVKYQQTLFGKKLTDSDCQKNGFQQESGYWWNKGLVQFYSATDGYYLPLKTQTYYFAEATKTQTAEKNGANSKSTSTSDERYAPSLNVISEVVYDAYYVLPTSSISVYDANTKDTVTVENDYQHLAPFKTTDPNDIVDEVCFDPLGVVAASSSYKTYADGKKEGDNPLTNFDYQVFDEKAPEAIISAISSNDTKGIEKYLQGASAIFYYNENAWLDNKQPLNVLHASRTQFIHGEDQYSEDQYLVDVAYFDGLSRNIMSKSFVKSEVLDKQDAYKIEDNKALVVQAALRWLTSGKKVYDNKGQVVETYQPYYSDTWQFQNDQAIVNLLPRPDTHYYDPLGRQIKLLTSKGFLQEVTFDAWTQQHFDEDDTVDKSPFKTTFDKNYPSKPTQAQQDEKDALEKASVFNNTPNVTALDNLGRTFLTVDELKQKGGANATFLETRLTLDIMGNPLTSTDPRGLVFTQKFNMLAQAIYTDSVDANARWVALNMFNKLSRAWDSRGFCTSTSYDRFQRPIATSVQGKDAQGLSLDQVVERMEYGETVPNAKDHNLLNEIVKTYDSAGLVANINYDILGNLTLTSQQVRNDYKEEVNWQTTTSVSLGTAFISKMYYDALGREVAMVAPDGRTTVNTYNTLSELEKVTVDKIPYVNSIVYAATAQPTAMSYGNGVRIDYTYEATTRNLLVQRTSRTGQNSKVLQNLYYTYDPQGNISRSRDKAQDLVYHNQEEVNPLSDYTYDSIYRLIKASGRQHPSLQQAADPYGLKQTAFSVFVSTAHKNDKQKLELYTEAYAYDASNNLTQLKHAAKSATWVRKYMVSESSNRAFLLNDKNKSKNPDQQVDANGNSLGLENCSNLQWDYRNNLSQATVITREGDQNDADYYIYDGGNNRVLKVNERKINGNQTEITKTIYLGGYEVKQIITKGTKTITILERHDLHVEDGSDRMAIAHKWTIDTTNRETNKGVTEQVRYQQNDHLGSSNLETDQQGKLLTYEIYLPYGGTALIAADSEKEVSIKTYRYSGKERDDTTGLYYYGVRYYSPSLCRWINPDPGGAIDGLNFYLFVGGNPINKVDEKGFVKKKPKKRKKPDPKATKRTMKRYGPHKNLGIQIGEEGKAGRGFGNKSTYDSYDKKFTELKKNSNLGFTFHREEVLAKAFNAALEGNTNHDWHEFDKFYHSAEKRMDEHLSTSSTFTIFSNIGKGNLNRGQKRELYSLFKLISHFRTFTAETGNSAGAEFQHPTSVGTNMHFTISKKHGTFDNTRVKYVGASFEEESSTSGPDKLLKGTLLAASYTLNMVTPLTASNANGINSTPEEQQRQTGRREVLKQMIWHVRGVTGTGEQAMNAEARSHSNPKAPPSPKRTRMVA